MLLRAAAVRVDGQIYAGHYHYQVIATLDVDGRALSADDIGYVDGDGNFISLDRAAEFGIESSDDLDMIDDFPAFAERR